MISDEKQTVNSQSVFHYKTNFKHFLIFNIHFIKLMIK